MYNGSGITNSYRHAKTLTGVKGYGSNSSIGYREEFGLGQNDAEQQMFYTHKYKYQTQIYVFIKINSRNKHDFCRLEALIQHFHYNENVGSGKKFREVCDEKFPPEGI